MLKMTTQHLQLLSYNEVKQVARIIIIKYFIFLQSYFSIISFSSIELAIVSQH